MWSPHNFLSLVSKSWSTLRKSSPGHSPGDAQPGGWRSRAADMLYGGAKRKVHKKTSKQDGDSGIYTVDVELDFPRYFPDDLTEDPGGGGGGGGGTEGGHYVTGGREPGGGVRSRGSISSSYFENCYAEIPNEGYPANLRPSEYLGGGSNRLPPPRYPAANPHSTPIAKSPDSGVVDGSSLKDRTINEYDVYQDLQKQRRQKRKYAVIHVIVMALAGVAYLGAGVLAGFYIGQSQCTDDLSTVLPSTISSSSALIDTDTDRITTPTVIDDIVKSTLITTLAPVEMTSSEENSTAYSTAETSITPQIQCYSLVDGTCMCGPFGSEVNGREFSDRESYMKAGNVTGFTISHNDYFIGSLQLWYGNKVGEEHGYTSSGFQVHVALVRDESIMGVDLDFTLEKSFLIRLTFHTNLRTLGPYGGEGALTSMTRGTRLLYITGRAGPLVDQMTLYYDRCK